MITNATARVGGAPAFAEHEHRDLVSGINRIHQLACDVSREPTQELSVHVLGVVVWLERILEPHVAWEESWLYPEIDRRAGTPWATRLARFDHQQLAAATARLREDQHLLARKGRSAVDSEIRCHLFALESLLRAHIEREERFLIPLLENVAPVEPPA